MTTKSIFRKLFVLSLAFFLTPQVLFAKVTITEVMYNPDGADTGAEWVELYNDSSAAVSIAGWKFNDGSNHNIADPTSSSGDGGRGVLSVPAGGTLILSNEPATFIAQYGSYTGSVIKSALSLNNTSASLSLVTDTGVTEDSVSYTKDAGAIDDGNSLHRSGAALAAGAPNPGVYSGTAPAPIVSSDTSGSSNTNTTSSSNTSSGTNNSSITNADYKNAPAITALIKSDTSAIVGAGTTFSAKAFNTKKEPLKDARYIWNFGDGATTEGESVMHTFTYPGAYTVVLTAASGYSSARAEVRVTAAAVDITLATESDQSLLVVNHSTVTVDIGLWFLSCTDANNSAKNFIVPEHTSLAPSGGIRFASAITGLSCGADATLNYPNGTKVAKATPGTTSPLRGEVVAPEAIGNPQAVGKTSAQTSVSPSSKISKKVTNTIHVADFAAPQVSDDTAATNTSLTASVADSIKAMPTMLLVEMSAAFCALLALCGAGLWYARRAFAPEAVPVDEFDIE